MAGAHTGPSADSRVAGVRQLPDHQPDRVLPRGAPLPRPGGRPARQARASPAHLVQRGLHRRRALLAGHDGGRDAGQRPRPSIVCSDIDTKVLATAQRGVYSADARGLSPERLRRHFLRGTGANSGFIRVKPELARLIEFRSFNLMSPAGRGRQPGRALRHRVLPQRDDLLRQPHAAQGARADARVIARRAAVRGAFRELHRLARPVPPARQDHLRAGLKRLVAPPRRPPAGSGRSTMHDASPPMARQRRPRRPCPRARARHRRAAGGSSPAPQAGRGLVLLLRRALQATRR
jgi:hypothetical protein